MKCEMNYDPCLVASLQSQLTLTFSFAALKCLISLVADAGIHLGSFWPDYWRALAIYVSFPKCFKMSNMASENIILYENHISCESIKREWLGLASSTIQY